MFLSRQSQAVVLVKAVGYRVTNMKALVRLDFGTPHLIYFTKKLANVLREIEETQFRIRLRNEDVDSEIVPLMEKFPQSEVVNGIFVMSSRTPSTNNGLWVNPIRE